MAPEQRRPHWQAVIIALLGGLLLVGLVVRLTGGQDPDVSAAAQDPAVDEMPAAMQPVVTFLGDSWTEGVGATSSHGYAPRTAERLGWDHHVLGVGGSGYVQAGNGDPFDQRITRAVATDPDVLVIQGSLNDGASPREDLERATARTLEHLRAVVDPDTVVLVLGSSYTPGTDPAVIDGINRVIAAAAADAGFEFVDPAAENWNDPAVAGIWADPNHPNDRGHQLLARRLAPVLASLLDR